MKPEGGWAIVLSFVVAFMLMTMPWPDWAHLWRPSWLTMVLIYWCLAVPRRVGIGVGWMLGLFQDVLMGTLLGQHAMGMALVAFFSLKFHLRIRVLPYWQQGISVFLLVLLERSLAVWVKGMQGSPTPDWAVWPPALTSMLLWPWLFITLRDIRRKYHVS